MQTLVFDVLIRLNLKKPRQKLQNINQHCKVDWSKADWIFFIFKSIFNLSKEMMFK